MAVRGAESKLVAIAGVAGVLTSVLSGCAIFRKKPPVEPPPSVSKLTAPYPEGVEYEDLRSFFFRKDAPSAQTLERCDFDYQVERRLSVDKEGLFTAFPEHVKANPNGFHWCFYYKLYRILEAAQAPERQDEARRLVVENYPFITHVARVFQADFGEVRYLRAAVHQYRKLSRALYFVGVKPTGRTEQETGSLDDSVENGADGLDVQASP